MKGIIAAGSPQTTAAGAEMLRAGGNAVDAAVAAAFASFVAEASISALGGGGFALVHAPDQPPVLYDFFGVMPGLGAGSPPRNLDFRPVRITFSDATSTYYTGRGSTVVPGNPAGLSQLLQEHGTLPLADVVQPAIRLAREGFALNRTQAYLFRLLEGILRYTPECAALFAPGGDLLGEDDRFRSPAFAETLVHLGQTGADTFYRGELAAALVEDHRTHGGLITAQDLARYEVLRREPLQITYRGYTVYTNPPPSLGGPLIAYALRLLEQADFAALTHGSADHIALLAEIMRMMIVARRRDQPALLNFRQAWGIWLSAARIRLDWRHVQWALQTRPPRSPLAEPPGHSSTTHISVMDETGLAVGLTTTPGETGGYVVGQTGILMNNMLGEIDLNPEGFHKWAPGMRLYSMMAPTIVADARGPRLVVGSGGANRLRGAILQLLSNTLDWGLPIQEAVERPRVHFEDDIIDLELGYDSAAANTLAARGYDVRRWHERSLYFGGTHVAVRHDNGTFGGAGDSRRGGSFSIVET